MMLWDHAPDHMKAGLTFGQRPKLNTTVPLVYDADDRGLGGPINMDGLYSRLRRAVRIY
jgi:hypothetical protein